MIRNVSGNIYSEQEESTAQYAANAQQGEIIGVSVFHMAIPEDMDSRWHVASFPYNATTYISMSPPLVTVTAPSSYVSESVVRKT